MKLPDFYPSGSGGSGPDTEKITNIDPTSADVGYPLGYIWKNTTNGKYFVCTTTGIINDAEWSSINEDSSTIYDADYQRVINPAGGMRVSVQPETGAFVITGPVKVNATIRMRVCIANFPSSPGPLFTVDIGCSYDTVAGYSFASAHIVGNPDIKFTYKVRFGKNASGFPVIYIGELNTVWDYSRIAIMEVVYGAANGVIIPDINAGWTIGLESTAFQNLTSTVDALQVGYQSTANTPDALVKRDASGNIAAAITTTDAITSTDYKRIVNPSGGYLYAEGVNTGAICIKLPKAFSNTMFSMKLTIHQYTQANLITDVSIGGHLMGSGYYWYCTDAFTTSSVDSNANLPIRFGKDANNFPLIYIGDLTKSWDCVGIMITEVSTGFQGTGIEWAKGWNISFESVAFKNVTITKIYTQVGFSTSTNAGNTLVKRDINGNFVAGTITATLAGTASAVPFGGITGKPTTLEGYGITGTLSKPLFQVQDQKPSGTTGGTSAIGIQTRTLNTITVNEIAGAALSGNQITLPAGTYYIEAVAPFFASGTSKLYLYNITSGSNLIIGPNSYSAGGNYSATITSLSAKFTIYETSIFEIRQYLGATYSNTGLGNATSQGMEIYTNVMIWKEDAAYSNPVITDPKYTLDKPFFHAQDRKEQGTQGGASIAGTQTRVLNTILTNEIPGASLSSNQITLPAGEYYVEGSAPAFCTSYNKTRLYNITTSAYILEGQSSVASSTYTSMSNSIIAGKISSATQFTLELRHYTSIVKTTEGLGTAANQGTEVYADFKVWALNQERAIPLVSNTTGNNPGIIQGGDISSSGNTLSITPTSCLDSSALIPLVITSGKTLVIPSTNNQDFFVFIVKLVSDGSMVYKAYTTFEAPTSDILINAYRFISYCKTNGSGVVIPFLQNGCEWTTLSRLDILVASSLGTSYTAYNINAIVPVVICERMKLWFEGLNSNGQGHISYDGVNITYIGGYIGGKHDVLAVNTLYMKYNNVNFGIYITDLKLRR